MVLTVGDPDVAAGPNGDRVREVRSLPRGQIVEYDATENIFQNPRDPRTEAYVTGRVG